MAALAFVMAVVSAFAALFSAETAVSVFAFVMAIGGSWVYSPIFFLARFVAST